ncbi:MAG TPA: glycosyltransferase family 39 protein [Candidatus Kryptonia bacterium]
MSSKSADYQIIRRGLTAVRPILLSRWYLPTIIAFGFAIRLYWILVFHPYPVSDFGFYFHSAESIVKGYGYVTDHGFATAYFPIGYPFFLAILFWVFGVSVTVAETANLILSVASLVLAYRIARAIFKSEAAGWFSLLFLAIYPNNISYTSLVSTEILYLFLLLLGLDLLLPCVSAKGVAHVGRLLTAGFVFAFATLVKVQTLFLPAFLLLLFPKFWRERVSLVSQLKRVAVLYVAFIIGLSPWIIRNYELFNDIVLTNTGGLNLYIGNGPEANGTFVEIPWLGAVNSMQDEYNVNQIARRKAIDYIERHPRRTVSLMPKKLVALFDSGDGLYWNTEGTGKGSTYRRHVLSSLDQLNSIYESIVYVIFVASLLFGCWKRLRYGKDGGWPLLGIAVIFYFVGIYLVYYGAARYNFPIIPWMIMYSAALLASPFEKRARGS